MPTCVPIKDMKDTAAFARTVEQAATPVTVTRNGYDAFVVMRSDDYEALQEELARMRLMERVARAEHEFATGRYADGASFVKDIRERYGL
ncbi:MAG TPA: type II toxin-antitoxin system Phd/YefM family antitoxin [Candidatus Rubneribacter avistercoris]|nr:type II toxin-antitoxin system Phd/YefM family antitoxin [Candidatus Rubneribacter avistercoris]